MTRDGECYPLPTSAPPTSVNAGGALQNVPTPTVNGNYNRKGISPKAGDGLATWVKKNNVQAPAAGSKLNPEWVEWLQGWPIGWTESGR